jgi:hypothetical protein
VQLLCISSPAVFRPKPFEECSPKNTEPQA